MIQSGPEDTRTIHEALHLIFAGFENPMLNEVVAEWLTGQVLKSPEPVFYKKEMMVFEVFLRALEDPSQRPAVEPVEP